MSKLPVVAVVGLTLIGLVLSAPSASAEHPESIFYNSQIVTMEEGVPTAEAIAIRGGRIVAIGTNEEILALRGRITRVVDLGARTVLPGFIDSHAHWIGNRNISGIASAPTETGRRWVPYWETGDRSAGSATAQEAVQAALKGGWTSISELFVDQERLDELLALDEAGELRIRVNAYLPLSFEFERFGKWYQFYNQGDQLSPNVRIGGVKIFSDNGDNYGQGDIIPAFSGPDVFFTQEELTALVAQAHTAGFQIAIHAMADAGLDLVLNAYEDALQGESNSVYRHRVEHLALVRDDQLDRMARLGLIASIPLTWFDSHPWYTWDVRHYFGLERADLVARWRDILAAGIPSIGGTDYPWFYGDGSATTTVSRAVTRIGEPGQPPADWMLDQRITVEQALRLLTIDAAYGTFQEDVKGSIAVGKFADLVVLSANPLTVPPDEIKDIEVLLTMVNGRVEYCAPISFFSSPVSFAACL